MKLALVLGKQQGSTIVQRLRGIKDNLNIDVFDNIPEFIDSSMKRNSIYDRILVLSTKITNTTLSDLYNYWSSTSKETQVVMLSKSGVDESKSQLFLDTFKTPVAAVMLVDTTTVQLIAEAVLRPTADLTRDYGIKNFLKGELDEDVFEEPMTVKNETSQIVNVEQKQSSRIENNNEKEKRTLLGTLFGKKKTKQVINNKDEHNDLTANSEKESQLNTQEKNNEENLVQVGSYNNTEQDFESNIQERNIIEQQPSVNYSTQYDTQQNQIYNTEDELNEDTGDFTETSIPVESSTKIESEKQYEDSSLDKNEELVEEISSPIESNQDYSYTSTPITQIANDFTPELYNVDEEFGTLDIQDSNKSNTNSNTSPTLANEDFGNLGVGSEEDSYRQANEAPKVVTKTVVKEVIRHTGAVGGGLVALNSVYSGRARKIVIVTGDRGSGVTSTAYNIAMTLAKKVDILYFDCDIENHGLLSYLDYNNFKNYENTHMSGVKMCKTSQALDKCAISWEENFYILTTDYSCDTTLDELRQASEIVAERATDFGVVVVDCPVDKLEYISDLILTGVSVICVEGSKRGFMNMLCQLERSKLSMRFKRTLAARGNLFVTKCAKRMDLNKLVKYIKAIYEPESVDWLSPKITAFDGRLNDRLLNEILEG